MVLEEDQPKANRSIDVFGKVDGDYRWFEGIQSGTNIRIEPINTQTVWL